MAAGDIQPEILAVLATEPEAAFMALQVGHAIGAPPGRVAEALRALERNAQVYEPTPGRYRLSDRAMTSRTPPLTSSAPFPEEPENLRRQRNDARVLAIMLQKQADGSLRALNAGADPGPIIEKLGSLYAKLQGKRDREQSAIVFFLRTLKNFADDVADHYEWADPVDAGKALRSVWSTSCSVYSARLTEAHYTAAIVAMRDKRVGKVAGRVSRWKVLAEMLNRAGLTCTHTSIKQEYMQSVNR
jgi:hypothetical protein